MRLIEFIKIELDEGCAIQKILQTPDYVADRLKKRIESKEILLWTVHFAQGRNADISQAFIGFTENPAKDVELPNSSSRLLEYFINKYKDFKYPLFGNLPAIIARGGGIHKDYFLIGCIDVILLKPIEQLFPNPKSTISLTKQQQQQKEWAEVDVDTEIKPLISQLKQQTIGEGDEQASCI